MKRILHVALLSTILVGCSTNTYQGVPENAFPRHKLNFLFKESFSLDYSNLKASNWKMLHQTNTGAFAKTEIIPNNEADTNWQKKITIAYYPITTVPSVDGAFSNSLNYAKKQLAKDCSLNNNNMSWSTIESSDNEIMARIAWPACSQEGITRLQKTSTGLNEITFIKKGSFSADELNDVKTSLEEAKIVEYQN